ncbi:MFS transporter [Erythrobacter sp.]|uniref:MFS transporter n=1 Tax=Erythrobacter sp. TaxID=1042 RepID=UPI0025F3F31F|nr:MFS transporter [Erythrobacter sp.]
MRQLNAPILASVAFIVFVDMIGLGLIIPVMPRLISELADTSIYRSAEIGGLLMFSYAGMQFLFAPAIGGLSDRFGRRPVLLTTLFLLAADYAVMALAPTLVWLVAGRMMSGIMGASWAAANSCVADCVTPEKRGRAFGLLAGAGAAGFVLGPAIGGLAGEFGTRAPFIIAASLALIGVGVGLVFLKETLPLERRRSFNLVRANPVGSIIQMSKKPFVLSCLFVIFLMQLSSQAQISIWAYWGELQFGWTPSTTGYTASLYGVVLGFCQAVLTGRSVHRFGAANTARFALLFGIPSYLILAFADSTASVILAIFIGALAGMTLPALQSLMSSSVDEDAQGELQGAIASMLSLTAIIGPVVMTQTFSFFSDDKGVYFPGAPFIISLASLLAAISLLWIVTSRRAAA